MSPAIITAPQLRRLQTLYGQLCAHTHESNAREARLAWAGDLIGRAIASFSDLTRAEAQRLIDALQGQLGVRAPLRRRRGRAAAQRHGKDGRRDGQEFAAVPELVGAEDIAAIEAMYARLGWNRDRFDGWLRSAYSPLKRNDAQIRTKADANRVRWALKGMLQHNGLWEERKPA